MGQWQLQTAFIEGAVIQQESICLGCKKAQVQFWVPPVKGPQFFPSTYDPSLEGCGLLEYIADLDGTVLWFSATWFDLVPAAHDLIQQGVSPVCNPGNLSVDPLSTAEFSSSLSFGLTLTHLGDQNNRRSGEAPPNPICTCSVGQYVRYTHLFWHKKGKCNLKKPDGSMGCHQSPKCSVCVIGVGNAKRDEVPHWMLIGTGLIVISTRGSLLLPAFT